MDKRYGEDGTDYHLRGHRLYEYWLFGATLRFSGVCSQCERHYAYCLRCLSRGWYMVSMEEGVRV